MDQTTGARLLGNGPRPGMTPDNERSGQTTEGLSTDMTLKV